MSLMPLSLASIKPVKQWSPEGQPAGRPPRILMVSEDVQELKDWTQVFNRRGYGVRACSSYNEAARCLESEKCDLILVDQGSPAFEGRVILESAAKANRRSPVLVLARSHDMHCYLEAMQLGAVDYLEKPLPAPQIVRLVERYLPYQTSAA